MTGRELLGDRAAGAADGCPGRDRRVRPQGGREAPPSRDARDLGGGTGRHAGRHPGLAIDLARLGPVEPMLVAGMGCGLALALASTRRLLERGRSARALAARHSRAGYCPLAARRLPEGGVDLRAGPVPLPLPRARSPLARGRRDHGAAVPVAGLPARGCAAGPAPAPHAVRDHAGHRGRRDGVRHRRAAAASADGRRRLWDSAEIQWAFAPQLGTFVWPGVAAAVPFLLLAWAFGHRRVPWLPLGLLARGTRRLSLSGSGRGCQRRATSFRSWRSSPPRPSSCSPTGRGGFSSPGWSWWRSSCGTTSTGRTSASRAGRPSRRTRIAAVAEVARLDPARCPVYMAPVPCRGRRLRSPSSSRSGQTVERRPCDPRLQGHHDPGSPPASTRYERGHLRRPAPAGDGRGSGRRAVAERLRMPALRAAACLRTSQPDGHSALEPARSRTAAVRADPLASRPSALQSDRRAGSS